MKKMKFGLQQPKVLGIRKPHHENREEKNRQIKIYQKRQNELNKQLAKSPLLVGVASLVAQVPSQMLINYFEAGALHEMTKRQILYSSIDFSDPSCIDAVFPVNLLLVVTTGDPMLPDAYEQLHSLMKLQTRVVYWKIPFDDVLYLQIGASLTVSNSSKLRENVLVGSLFDLRSLCSVFEQTRGDFRAAWMRPRGVGKVLAAEQLSPETFKLRLIYYGKVSDSCYITKCGDFNVPQAGSMQFPISAHHFCADVYEQQQNTTIAYDPVDDCYEGPPQETPLSDDSESIYTTEVTESAPIEQDYEFKMDQRRTEPQEFVDRPDDIEIHPKRPLRQVLAEFAPMISARNSRFPFTTQPRPEKTLLCYIAQPGQLERQIVQQVATHFGEDEPEMSSFLDVIVTVPTEAIAEYSARMKEAALLATQDQYLTAELQSMQLFYKIAFYPADFVGQTLAFLLPNEYRVGWCHADCIKMHSSQILDLSYYYTVMIGFRRIYTLPIPYTQLSDRRGKLLRVFYCDKVYNLSFAFPSSLNALHSKPLPVAFFVANYLIATARTRDYRVNFQMLYRIVLTGWPYRIHRRKCICRFMFFNKDDVVYFKSAELSAGLLNGKIIEPLGEKGYFKCFFDKQIYSGQVIEMKLYMEEAGLGIGLGVWGLCGCGYEPVFARAGQVYHELLDRLFAEY